MSGLSEQDQAFLERTRKGMGRSLVFGWLFVVLPFALGGVLAANFQTATEQFHAIQEPLFEKFALENAQLEALDAATPLERQLVQHALEKNARILAVMKGFALSTMIVLMAWVFHGLLSAGFSILGHRKSSSRWLRIVDTLEQRPHA